MDVGFLGNPGKALPHLGAMLIAAKPASSQEPDERNPLLPRMPPFGATAALSSSQVTSQLSDMNNRMDTIMRGVNDVIAPISSVEAKLSDGSSKLDLLLTTCGNLSDCLGELLSLVKKSQQQLVDMASASSVRTAAIDRETQTHSLSPRIESKVLALGPDLQDLQEHAPITASVPVPSSSKFENAAHNPQIPLAMPSKRKTDIYEQGDSTANPLDLPPPANQRKIRPRMSSDAGHVPFPPPLPTAAPRGGSSCILSGRVSSASPGQDQRMERGAASDPKSRIQLPLKARRTPVEPAREDSSWIVKAAGCSPRSREADTRMEHRPTGLGLPAYRPHKKPAVHSLPQISSGARRQSPAPSLRQSPAPSPRQSPAPSLRQSPAQSLISRLLEETDEMNGECSGNERFALTGANEGPSGVKRPAQIDSSMARSSGAATLGPRGGPHNDDDKLFGCKSAGSGGQCDSNNAAGAGSGQQGFVGDNDEDLARQVAMRMKRHRERRTQVKKHV